MSMDGATKTTPVQFIRFIRVMSSPFGLGGGEIPLPTALPNHLMLAPAALKASLSFFSQSLAAALPGFGLGKLLLCLDMLQERRLVALLGGEERKSAEILPTQGKVDIFASPVFQRAEALVGKQG